MRPTSVQTRLIVFKRIVHKFLHSSSIEHIDHEKDFPLQLSTSGSNEPDLSGISLKVFAQLLLCIIPGGSKKRACVWTPTGSVILNLCLIPFAELPFDFLRVDPMSFRAGERVLVHWLTLWNTALKTAYSFGKGASKNPCKKFTRKNGRKYLRKYYERIENVTKSH